MANLKMLGLVIIAATAVIVAVAPILSAEPPAAPSAAPAQTPAALKIGVIDLPIIFQKYKKSIEFENKIKAIMENTDKEFTARKKELEDLKEQLDGVRTTNPDSEKYQNLSREISKKSAIFKADQESALSDIDKQVEKASQGFLTDITDAIKKFGKANGYSLILKSDSLPFESDLKAMRAQLAQRSVLYYSDALDITNDVLNLLNSGASVEGKQGEEKK
jgi:Skp family chaperone for outer membrane proteins